MQGSSLLALKRKIQEVENTKSAGNLERIKHEKNWPSFKTFKMTDGYLKLGCLSYLLKIPVPEFETARFALRAEARVPYESRVIVALNIS